MVAYAAVSPVRSSTHRPKPKRVIPEPMAFEADAVICAAPGTKVPDLIPGLPEATRRALGTVNYSTGCRVVIGLDHSPLPPGWHGALYPEGDDTPLLLDRSAFLPGCAPAGKSILDLLIGRDRAKELIPLEDDEIKRRMPGAARRNAPPGSALPGDDEGLFHRVYRWEEALCMGTPGMLAALAKIPGTACREHRQPVSGGHYMGIPSVNGALSSGHRAGTEAAERLMTRGT